MAIIIFFWLNLDMDNLVAARSKLSRPTSQLSIGLVTCSFSGDLALCRMLCESIDKFVPHDIEHMLIVPKAEVHLFSSLKSSRRTVVSAQEFQPWWFFGLPRFSPTVSKLLCLPRREVILTPCSLPVRGWIVQQILKIAASAEAPWDIILHVDSDICFVRPFQREQIVQDDKVRFYRHDNPEGQVTARRWHRSASALLGLPPTDYLGAGYINSLVVWRRSVARALVERLHTINHADWRNVLARCHHFSEYILYGALADHVMGHQAAGLFETSEELCHNCWDDLKTSEAEDQFVNDLQNHQITYLVQSTAALSYERRVHLFERMIERAASTA